MSTKMNLTEKSFFDFFIKSNRKIEKILEEQSPDFLVDNKFAFEIKEITTSGTEINNGNIKIQKINATSVINSNIDDAIKKINNYKKIKKIDYFGLVIYNSRYRTPDHILDGIKKSYISKYPAISSIIFAGYNKPSNLTVALTLYNNDKSKIDVEKKIFHNMNVKK